MCSLVALDSLVRGSRGHLGAVRLCAARLSLMKRKGKVNFALSGQCSRFKMVDLCGSSATRVQHIHTVRKHALSHLRCSGQFPSLRYILQCTCNHSSSSRHAFSTDIRLMSPRANYVPSKLSLFGYSSHVSVTDSHLP